AVSPAMVRIGVGVLLIAYASYSLLKPKIKPFDSGPVTDTGVGILNGMLVGLTGLGCVVITIWTQMRNWPKDVQRTVFQPVIMATMSITAVTYAINGVVHARNHQALLHRPTDHLRVSMEFPLSASGH
ncbi:MAG: hypothetical protein WA697_13180, partial [Pseudolabrys sp.]